MNEIEFMRDMLGRKLSLADINKKYNLVDCVQMYLLVKQQYPQDFINDIVKEVYYND